jgi:type II restriction/modification system DNA methylase subunit YeeA
MNTKDLKAYAPKARRDFIAAITKQAQKYGVTEIVTHPVEINGDVCVVNGKPFPASLAPKINKLGERVKSNGFESTMEQVAYSWFNRLIAIRYMELHDYLGHGRRVLSHPEHPTGFQILEECTELTYGNSGEAGELPDLTHERVVELKLDGTKDEELYRELLLAQCHALHKAMPFLFETIDDETELLLPENLTNTDSLIHDLITDLAESDWESIEVVGWLYQFYISEKKDEVIGKVVKSEDIPAATQLFTPNWIVKYMVQNSLGAQWLATYPESPLKAEMEYYIEPAEQTDEVNAQLKAITPESLNPEELTLIDPASGSGHILVEAYDLFKAIYLERGYRTRDIAQHILEKNLFGLDIDQRAAQLTGFALMMKGREDDRRLFERGVKLNVMAMVNSTNLDVDILIHSVDLTQYGLKAEDITALKDLFEHATTFGSLIQVQEDLAKKLPAMKQLSEVASQDLFVKDTLEHFRPLMRQVEILASQFDAVVANPPYMGSKGMNSMVKNFVKNSFSTAKNDLFACFIERGYTLAKDYGYNAMITMQSWMFLSSFEKMRERMLREKSILTMAHLGARAFDSISGEVVQTTAFVLQNKDPKGYRPVFARLLNGGECEKREALKSGDQRFQSITQEDFKVIPGSPLSYWVPTLMRDLFLAPKCADKVDAKQGLATCKNELFLRSWFEVAIGNVGFNFADSLSAAKSSLKWFPYNKGGEYRSWYGNSEFIVNWQDHGRDIHRFSDLPMDYAGAPVRAKKFYFRSSVSWTDLTSKGLSARYYPVGHVFDVSGHSAFSQTEEEEKLLLCFLNTRIAEQLGAILNSSFHFQVGDFKRLPYPDESLIPETKKLATEAVAVAKQDWNNYESSWDFQSLPMMPNTMDTFITLESSYLNWVSDNENGIANLKRLEEKNNSLFIDAYNLAGEITPEVDIERVTLTVNPAYRYGIKKTEEERNIRFREDSMQELISYAIGCMMGRYSLDEPGLIYANSGNTNFNESRYKNFPADDDGIIPLTDKEWFSDDASNRLVEFISVVYPSKEGKDNLEENLNFLAENLSPKKGEDSRDTIRRYLCDKFYKDHMQTYKKRPIYWLFSSGKQKAFQCLVYLHRYNESTLARMRTEYVIPLTAKLSSHIEKLENDKDASGSAAEIKKLEKEIKNLHKQQTELTEFDEKLKHYADMRIPLDLDDGVKVNYGKFGDLLSDVKAIHGKAV